MAQVIGAVAIIGAFQDALLNRPGGIHPFYLEPGSHERINQPVPVVG